MNLSNIFREKRKDYREPIRFASKLNCLQPAPLRVKICHALLFLILHLSQGIVKINMVIRNAEQHLHYETNKKTILTQSQQ